MKKIIAKNNDKFRRIEYLDVAKFMGLVLVCFCHIPFPEGVFHVWVYSYHMPLFFLISGAVFSIDRFAIGKSVRQFIIPFLCFNILATVISVAIEIITIKELIFPKVSLDFILKSTYIIGPSWFLLSLFLTRVYCGVLLKYLGSIWLIASALFVLLIFFFTHEYAVWKFLSLGSTVLGLPFYTIGMFCRRIFLNEAYMGKWWVPIVALSLSIPAIYNGQVGIHANSFGYNLLLFLTFGLSGTILIISMSRHIKIPHSILSVFMNGALFFICMHTLIFEYSILIWNKITGDFSGNTIPEKIVFTAITFLLSYPIIVLMLKETPFLLGKTKKKNVVDK